MPLCNHVSDGCQTFRIEVAGQGSTLTFRAEASGVHTSEQARFDNGAPKVGGDFAMDFLHNTSTTAPGTVTSEWQTYPQGAGDQVVELWYRTPAGAEQVAKITMSEAPGFYGSGSCTVVNPSAS